jgi:hypothetical protein
MVGCLFRHAEATGRQFLRHVLGSLAEERQLQVVNHRGTRRREAGDETAFDERADVTRESHLHRMRANEPDDLSLRIACTAQRYRRALQRIGREHVRKRALEKSPGFSRESARIDDVVHAHLGRTRRDGNRTDRGEICFVESLRHRCAYFFLAT